jgi:hypothetical protein
VKTSSCHSGRVWYACTAGGPLPARGRLRTRAGQRGSRSARLRQGAAGRASRARMGPSGLGPCGSRPVVGSARTQMRGGKEDPPHVHDYVRAWSRSGSRLATPGYWSSKTVTPSGRAPSASVTAPSASVVVPPWSPRGTSLNECTDDDADLIDEGSDDRSGDDDQADGGGPESPADRCSC